MTKSRRLFDNPSVLHDLYLTSQEDQLSLLVLYHDRYIDLLLGFWLFGRTSRIALWRRNGCTVRRMMGARKGWPVVPRPGEATETQKYKQNIIGL